MAADEKWYFTKEQLSNTPSRKCGYEVDKELSYRQQAANFIQDMGQRLQVTQLCINTAIVYMHRFYVFHSFTHFHRNAMAAAALFLAAKVEEQPRKLEHVIKVAHMCLNRDQPPLDTKSEKYLEHAQDLVFNENVLLQTLGFDVAIDHPHTHVVRCCHLVRASKDLAQTSYFMASNSLHLTTMCLQYKPTVVACFCIHLACKWSNWEIPQSNEGKDWFWYVDKTVTLDQLEQLTAEFLVIFDKCPTKLKRKIMSISATQNPTMPPPMSGSLFDMEPRKIRPPDGSQQMAGPSFQTGVSSRLPPLPQHLQGEVTVKPPVEKLPSVPGPQPRVDYKEKKERERLAQQPPVPRDGHPSKSMPSTSSKHGPPPPGMINKPHHRDHKHPPPMRPGGSQPRGREQSYTKREHIFAPPIRHSEPQLAPDTNHVGVNCNPSSRHEVAMEHITRDLKAMPVQMESSSKRSQQPGFESSSRHNRVPTSANSEGRAKEEVSSKMVPDVGHTYNHKHGMDHSRHRRVGVNDQFPPRPPEGVSERKSADIQDRKALPVELVDRKPSVPELVDRKPDIADRKLNVHVHPAFSENRRPDNSKQVYHHTQVKPDKKEDIAEFGGRVGNSSLRPAPPLPPAIAPPLPPLPHQEVLQIPSHKSSSRSKSPLQPPRSRSPVAPPHRRSDSPHGKVKSSAPLPPRNGATLEEKPVVVKRPETPPVPEVEVKPSVERHKSSVVTPDKASTTLPKESPYPRSKSSRQRTPPSSASKKASAPPLPEMPTTPVSPFGSPPLPGSASKLRGTNRHRTSSSSSEPELVPVVKKLDEIRGYENIIRDSKIGIKLPNRVPDIIPPIRDRNNKKEEPASSGSSVPKELKLPDIIGPIRSTSTKPPPSLPDDLGAVAFPDSDSTNGALSRTAIPPPSIVTEESNVIDVGENSVPSEHHHKSEKKKKKKEHKHKDKEKSREERKHKHKHKEKEKERHKTESARITITIPKDKIVSSILEPANNPGLKLKIPKERLKDSDSTGNSPQSAPNEGLKIRISKDVINNFNSNSATPADTPSSSRKRDRSSPPPGPPSKSARLNTSTGEQRRTGGSSNNYGKQNGVEHHRRGGGGSHYSGNKVVQKMADSDNAGKSS